MRQFRWTGVIVLWLYSTSFSATTTFDANAVIQDGDVYDVVVVKGDNTTVNITGGEMNRLLLLDSCTVNISGGAIKGREATCYNNSNLIITGGSVGFDPPYDFYGFNFYALDSSRVTINSSPGVYYWGNIFHNAFASVEGGEVSLHAYNNSTVEVVGNTENPGDSNDILEPGHPRILRSLLVWQRNRQCFR